MELKTITQVTVEFGVTTRMLRYYEQIGLLASRRMENYAYRVYDEEAIARLKQIMVLRKLRIPLKQIATLLSDDDARHAVDVFTQSIGELDEEIDSLSTIRSILVRFVRALRDTSGISLKADLLNDAVYLSMVEPLSPKKLGVKEEKTMDDLNKASANLNKLTDKNVRIIYLPPATVAAYQYEGEDPEMHVHAVINKFVLERDLTRVKPDLRHYGFNAPCEDEKGHHGYEIWVTIPEDMDVPEPIVKKQFDGGLYAAHMIPFGAFEEWEWLNEWVTHNDRYEYRGNWDMANMFGWLEEGLNYVNQVHDENPEGKGVQLDLLIPIQEKGK